MSKLDHIQAPKKFKYRDQSVNIHLHYTFTCHNRIFFTETLYKDLIDHTYKLTVTIKSLIDESGLASDFMAIDKLYHENIGVLLDGQNINETLPSMNTTAENLALWISDQFKNILEGTDEVVSVTIYESPTHGVSV